MCSSDLVSEAEALASDLQMFAGEGFFSVEEGAEAKGALDVGLSRARAELARHEEALAPVRDKAVPERVRLQMAVQDHTSLVEELASIAGLDAETLAVRHRIPLSFGVRALAHEPVRDRLWVSAAYSGRIWSISASDPSDRRAYGLCGQSRDLVAEPDGSVVVATDCGLFRIAGAP